MTSLKRYRTDFLLRSARFWIQNSPPFRSTATQDKWVYSLPCYLNQAEVREKITIPFIFVRVLMWKWTKHISLEFELGSPITLSVSISSTLAVFSVTYFRVIEYDNKIKEIWFEKWLCSILISKDLTHR